MANRLKMAIHDAILQLHAQHWSGRRIAQELENATHYLVGAGNLETLLGVVAERLASENATPVQPLPLVGTPEEVFWHEVLIGYVLDLNVPELGVEGPAEVVAVHPCPPIEPDDGTGRRVVTSVFRHTAANVVDLTTSASDEPIGTTANHPFWSEDRQAFVPAGALQPGERLRSVNGRSVEVVRLAPRRGPPVRVFNFEVEGEHVYSVGTDGVLVHNNCLANALGKAGEDAARILKNTLHIDSLSGAKLFRIPDELTKTMIKEVKNVRYLAFTSQIQDYLHYSMMEGKQFVLAVRKGAKFSDPLQALIDRGYITIEWIKPTIP